MGKTLGRALLGTLPLLAAVTGMFSPPAEAHGIHLQVRVEGDVLRGTAEYAGGGPITSARVAVCTPSGRSLGSARTDEEGRFTFAPREAVDHRFLLTGDPGHTAEASVAADALPGALVPRAEGAPGNPTGGDLAALVERAVSRQVSPLREEIDRLRHSLRLHDVLGGIGYIAGLAGLWFYFAARRLRQP